MYSPPISTGFPATLPIKIRPAFGITMFKGSICEDRYLELVCKKEDCYVYNVLQMVPNDVELICHNCGSELITWQPHNKRST